MYKEYFGIEEMPFSIAPDPRYLYMSEQHREALAHLLYGFNSDGGFVFLTGEIGTGKTTICRCLLEQVPKNSEIAFIINPKLTVEELLGTICDEFGISYPTGNKSIKVFIDLINRYLLELHKKEHKAVLIIDEAQNLSTDVLEQLRLLTNLETNQVKLLQIILLGQPELRDKLSRSELSQLSQRIIARYHLKPLSRKDVASYVRHRLTVAGAKKQLFTDSALDKLYRLSGGIPRLINMLCDRALLGAFAQGKSHVTKSILIKASCEVLGKSSVFTQPKKIYIPLIFFITIGIIFAIIYYNKRTTSLSTNQQSEVSESKGMKEALLHFISMTPQQSKAAAFQSLFKEWGLTYNPDEFNNACDFAKAHNLQCYYNRGNLRSLIIMNHPAILRLISKQGQEFYATLTDIQQDNATVMNGSSPIKVSLKDLESYWLGDYILIWRPPEQYQGEIKPGMQDVLVPWLYKQLALIQNTPYHSRDNTLYDKELAERVKGFQSAEGFLPDGIVGPQTLMRLVDIDGSNTPVLIKKTQDKKD